MNRFKIAQIIALGATVFSVVGGILAYKDIQFGYGLIGVGVIIGLVSYLFAGLGTALKMAGSIAKWGWLIVPFPMDIFTGALSFFFALIVFILLPIIPVRKAYSESRYY